jgi:hypothetical protein
MEKNLHSYFNKENLKHNSFLVFLSKSTFLVIYTFLSYFELNTL